MSYLFEYSDKLEHMKWYVVLTDIKDNHSLDQIHLWPKTAGESLSSHAPQLNDDEDGMVAF